MGDQPGRRGCTTPTCERCARMWEIILCGQTVGGTAMSWGTPVAWGFLETQPAFSCAGTSTASSASSQDQSTAGIWICSHFCKRKKNAILAFCLFIVTSKETASLSQFW